MPQRRSRKTKALALGAIMSALGVLMLFLGSVVEVLDLAMAQFASLITLVAVIEMGSYWPWLIYAVTGTLSMLLLPNRFVALVYILFTGFYPILKEKFEKLRKYGFVFPWVLKLLTFNLSLTAVIVMFKWLFSTYDLALDFSLLVYLLSNGLFILYDFVLSRLTVAYLWVWRKKFK